eukprot:CAMPEP_0173441866 /NCGR_PEP_ID=MMETSP1357-20121228/24190_1 /TAXON_ID=77926 /ORGANISM="Hemiselmis rufescens, Strain PCC563" /LENGTH=93 /DNA_ID=CAMNT_0014407477 /DNA_START=179 /DNA_END=456 /DNA_ORIENTATION=+
MMPLSSPSVRTTRPVCLAAGRAATARYYSADRPQKEKDAIIMRLRKKEEETKKYGAPKFQALFFGISGISAVGFGIWGWTQMDSRLGSLRSRG